MAITMTAESGVVNWLYPNGYPYPARYFVRHRYRQKPYVGDPLPYALYSARYDDNRFLLTNNGSWIASEADIQNGIISQFLAGGFGGPFSDPMVSCQNTSYQRVRSRFYGETASLGETFGEAQQSMTMIRTRLVQIANAAYALKKGNFAAFAHHLNLREIKGLRKKLSKQGQRWTRPRDASAVWLEYWLGWVPLISDIYNATQILDKPFPEKRTRISGSCTQQVSSSGRVDSDYIPGINTNTYNLSGSVRVRQGATFRVTNPNVNLAARLGLINPASVAWALVPMSFVVNWFVNVDKYLNSFTDFAGVEIIKPYSVMHAKATVVSTKEYRDTGWPAAQYATTTSHGARMIRGTALILPNLSTIKLNGLSPSRGATAISLIVQLFSPKK